MIPTGSISWIVSGLQELKVTCPRCDAPTGKRCFNTNKGASHNERIVAWRISEAGPPEGVAAALDERDWLVLRWMKETPQGILLDFRSNHRLLMFDGHYKTIPDAVVRKFERLGLLASKRVRVHRVQMDLTWFGRQVLACDAPMLSQVG